MIVAGIGCRRGCPAERIVSLVRQAAATAGLRVEALAAPTFKKDEPGLHGAATALGLRVHFVDAAALAAAQADCVTWSDVARRETGVGSVAEGAALAVGGSPLILPRFGSGEATCALAGTAPGVATEVTPEATPEATIGAAP